MVVVVLRPPPSFQSRRCETKIHKPIDERAWRSVKRYTCVHTYETRDNSFFSPPPHSHISFYISILIFCYHCIVSLLPIRIHVIWFDLVFFFSISILCSTHVEHNHIKLKLFSCLLAITRYISQNRFGMHFALDKHMVDTCEFQVRATQRTVNAIRVHGFLLFFFPNAVVDMMQCCLNTMKTQLLRRNGHWPIVANVIIFAVRTHCHKSENEWRSQRKIPMSSWSFSFESSVVNE